ncbi:hypothetical protein MNBD_GAMMA08-911 [hydrothermal vent metagenome]|uniref:Uncharacterized protein n=1 Tax=hydrothermal vent metagenome TaxID=652676 RepID=A0A3B0XE93_9ZZZZ
MNALWKTGFKQLAGVVAGLLSFDGRIEHKPEQSSICLGMLKSKGGRRWVSLFNQPLELEINGYKTPLNELLFIENGVLVIDRLRIEELLNLAPVNTAKKYIPDVSDREAQKSATQLMYQDWQDVYDALKTQHPKQNISWICRHISRLPVGKNKTPEYIRRKIKS